MSLRITLGIILLLLFSCKKEKDEIPPTIVITSPSENLTVSYGEEVRVQATITDNKVIRSVQLSLISSETNNRVLHTESFQPNSTSFELDDYYLISDSLLAGGEYYFRVEAQDDNTVIAAFRFITIAAFPRKKLSTVVSCSNGSITELFEDKNDFTFISTYTFNTPYLSSELNSFDQQFWFTPQRGKELKCLNLRSKEEVFSQSFISSDNEVFSSTDLENRNLFVSTRTGELQAYTSSFIDNYTYQSRDQVPLGKIRVGENYILTEEGPANEKMISVLFRSSGIVDLQLPIQENLVDLYFIDANSALLFQNNADGGLIQELDIDNSRIRKVTESKDSILSVKQIDDSEFILSSRSKVLRYQLNRNNLFDYLQKENAIVEYDEPNNQLFVASASSLEVYKLGETTPIRSANFQSPIGGINFRYNY